MCKFRQQVKVPISLLIGEGSRVCPFLYQASFEKIPVQITSVVSHKALLPDESGQKTKDVIGIAMAKSLGYNSAYFNLVQMRQSEKRACLSVGEEFDESEFRKNYFRILGAFLNQAYPVRPVAIFMNG